MGPLNGTSASVRGDSWASGSFSTRAHTLQRGARQAGLFGPMFCGLQCFLLAHSRDRSQQFMAV